MRRNGTEWLTRILLTAVVGTLQVGCPSLSTLQTARTVPRGKIRYAVGAEVLGAAAEGDTVYAPQSEFAMRFGVADNVDVGFKIFIAGIEGGAKFGLVRGPFDLSIAPSASFMSFSASNSAGDSETISFLYLHVPLLMGVHMGDVATFGFGPKFLYAAIFGDVSGEDEFAAVDGLAGGGYINFLFRIGDAFWLGPEMNIYTPFTHDNAFDAVLYQGGIAIMFGGPDEEEGPPGPPLAQ